MTAVEWARAAGSEKITLAHLVELERLALTPVPEVRDTLDGIRESFAEGGTRIEQLHGGAAIMAGINARIAEDETTDGVFSRLLLPFFVVLGTTIAMATLLRWQGDRDGVIRFAGILMLISAVLCITAWIAGRKARLGPATAWTIGAAGVSLLALVRAFILEAVAPLPSGPIWMIAIVVGTVVVVAYAVANSVRQIRTSRARARDLAPVRAAATAYLAQLRPAFDAAVAEAAVAASTIPEKERSALKSDRDKAFLVLLGRGQITGELPRAVHEMALGELQLSTVVIPLLGGSSRFRAL